MIDSASRYASVPILAYTDADGRTVRYLGRRFPSDAVPRNTVTVVIASGDRPDLLAQRALGDPLAFWRLADLNRVLDPMDLTVPPGRRVQRPAAGLM